MNALAIMTMIFFSSGRGPYCSCSFNNLSERIGFAFTYLHGRIAVNVGNSLADFMFTRDWSSSQVLTIL